MKLIPEEIRSRFEIVEHGPLSFEVRLDGEFLEEYPERSGADECVEFWCGKFLAIQNAVAAKCVEIAREYEKRETDYIAKRPIPAAAKDDFIERSIGAFSVRAAIRSHFQLPEKP